jgi:hypothetical protein
MRSPLARGLAAGAALVCLALLLARRRPEPEPLVPQPRHEATSPVDDALAAPPGADSSPRMSAPEPAQDAPPPAPGAAEKDELVALAGSWTLLDADGRPQAPLDGSFTLTFYEERDDERVGVVAGGWTVAVPPHARFDVMHLELGGRRAAPVEEPWGLTPPPDLRLDLTARWMHPVVLEVVDAQTMEPLSDVLVVAEGEGAA